MRGMWFGYEWNWQTGRHGKPVIYDSNRHVTLFGPTRCGKGVSVEIPTLLMHGTGGGGRAAIPQCRSIRNCKIAPSR